MEKGTIDLSSWRTDELVDAIVDLLYVPGLLGRIAFGGLLGSAGLTGLYATVHSDTSWWWVLLLWTPIAGLILGVVGGAMWVVSRATRNVESILVLTLHVVDSVASDSQRVLAGQARVPVPGALLKQVFDEVLVPSIERAGTRLVGRASRPGVWLLRKTVGWGIDKLAHTDHATDEMPADPVGYAAKMHEWVGSVQRFCRRFARRARLVVFLPWGLAYAGAALMLCMPLLLASG